MILQIRTWPDLLLLESCDQWNHNDPPLNSLELEQNLYDTLVHYNALGLAANQVGLLYRVLLIHTQTTNEYIFMYNPEIINRSENLWTHDEGCLSFPHIQLSISRPYNITVQWYDRDANKYTRVFDKIDAKCIDHELDHLNGIVFKKYVSNLKFALEYKKSKKRK